MKRFFLFAAVAVGLLSLLAGCGSSPGGTVQYTLTVTTVGDGSVTPKSAKFDKNTVVVLVPMPTAGWKFDKWDGPDAKSVIENKIIMSKDMSISAVFVQGETGTPTTPTVGSVVGQIYLPGVPALYPHSLALGSSFCLVTGDQGVIALDVTQPSSPSMISTYPGKFAGLDIRGTTAYVTTQPGSTRSLDVLSYSTLTSPVKLGSAPSTQFSLGAYFYDVAVADDTYAYVAVQDYNAGYSYHIFPMLISNPALPSGFIAGAVKLADGYGQFTGLTVKGNLLFSLDYYHGLTILDISNRTAPTIVGRADTPGWAGGLAASGNYVYVADGESGLEVMDVSNPSSPRIVANVDLYAQEDHGAAYDVDVEGNYAFVADVRKVTVVDISNPTSPQIKGIVPLPGSAQRIRVRSGYGYAVGTSSGLQVIRFTLP